MGRYTMVAGPAGQGPEPDVEIQWSRLMTTSEDKRGQGRVTLVVLALVALALAVLPALRPAQGANVAPGTPDCVEGSAPEAC